MAGSPLSLSLTRHLSVSDRTFRPAFELMQSAENTCMQEYFKKIQGLI
jgi:hypothetical protein